VPGFAEGDVGSDSDRGALWQGGSGQLQLARAAQLARLSTIAR